MYVFIIALIFILIIILCVMNIYRMAIEINKREKVVDLSLDYEANNYIYLNKVPVCIDNKLVDIDKVLISPKGIFVIDNYEYDGWIYGNDNDKYWTQIIYQIKNKFLNPNIKIKEEDNEIRKMLKSEIDNLPIVPVIVFNDNCTLKDIASDIPVIYNWQLDKYVLDYEQNNILSNDEMLRISTILKSDDVKGTYMGKRKDKSDMFLRKRWE